MAKSFFRWQTGRQQTGYQKMLLLSNAYWLPFDCYLLKYEVGAQVPKHTDPVSDKKHFRLNLILKKAKAGGTFFCEQAIYSGSRVKLFRPDKTPHSVSRVDEGVRYVLSIGWVIARKNDSQE